MTAVPAAGCRPGGDAGSGWAAAVAFMGAALDHLGREIADAEPLLRERGLVSGSRADVSENGSCRLVRSADGWLAINLPRPDDLELLPAWLGLAAPASSAPAGPPWVAIASVVVARASAHVVDAAQELGLAVAAVPESAAGHVDAQLIARGTLDASRPFVRTSVGRSGTDRTMSGVRVVDLSSLWAGPLCSRLLAEAGADVTKVESTTRPDGTRLGDPTLFERLHAGKRFAEVPFSPGESGAALRELIAEADVVIEGSRPRALDRLGIDPLALLAECPSKVWLSITAYGRTGPWRNRIGFGDDASAAAGLLDRDSAGELRFVGDAIADPLTGVFGAALITDAVAQGGGVMIDLALREVARSVALGAEVAW